MCWTANELTHLVRQMDPQTGVSARRTWTERQMMDSLVVMTVNLSWRPCASMRWGRTGLRPGTSIKRVWNKETLIRRMPWPIWCSKSHDMSRWHGQRAERFLEICCMSDEEEVQRSLFMLPGMTAALCTWETDGGLARGVRLAGEKAKRGKQGLYKLGSDFSLLYVKSCCCFFSHLIFTDLFFSATWLLYCRTLHLFLKTHPLAILAYPLEGREGADPGQAVSQSQGWRIKTDGLA